MTNIINLIKELKKKGYDLKLINNELQYNYTSSCPPSPGRVRFLLQQLKENKSKVIEVLRTLTIDEKLENGLISFDDWYKETTNIYRYEPRPDLIKDTKLWQRLLKLTEEKDKQLYSNLHGFRCSGCTLSLISGKLRLNPSISGNKQEYQEDRIKWLIPYKDKIIQVFALTEKELSNND